jgi:hypothetical protein
MTDEQIDALPDRWPRLRHWVIAAVILFVMGIIVPLFAAFI